jgi:hypothetical protein
LRLPSASKLDLFDACGGPWYLDTPADLPEVGAAAERGKVIHKHIEEGTLPAGEGKADVERARRAMADLPVHVPIPGVPLHEVVFRWNPWTDSAEVVGPFPEHPRETWTGRDVLMYGIADYAADAEGRLLIADLKTGSTEWLKMPWDGWQTPWLTAIAHKALKWPGLGLPFIVGSQAERAWGEELTAQQLADVRMHWSQRVVGPRRPLVPGEHCTFCPHYKRNCPLYG